MREVEIPVGNIYEIKNFTISFTVYTFTFIICC